LHIPLNSDSSKGRFAFLALVRSNGSRISATLSSRDRSPSRYREYARRYKPKDVRVDRGGSILPIFDPTSIDDDDDDDDDGELRTCAALPYSPRSNRDDAYSSRSVGTHCSSLEAEE
jgi:hypothetical protein